MGSQIAAADWSQSSLGHAASWPAQLRGALSLCLPAAVPMAVIWGPACLSFFNDSYCELWGADFANNLGEDFRTCWLLKCEAVRPAFERCHQTGCATSAPNVWLLLVRNGNQSEGCFSFSFNPIFDDEGNVLGVWQSVIEVTLQQLTRAGSHTEQRALDVAASSVPDIQKLAADATEPESEQQLRIMFELAAVGLGQADPHQGHLLVCNERFCKITGYSRDELLTMSMQVLTHPDDRESEWHLLQRALRGEISQYISEKRYVRKDGSLIWVRGNSVFLRDRTGAIFRILLVLEDISDRKHAEEALRQLNAELEARVEARTEALAAMNTELAAFSYSISHDLRAPLRAIDGFSRIVINDFGSVVPAEALSYLEDIRTSTQRMRAMVDDLLAFSRWSRQSLQKKQVDVNSLVHHCVGELQNLCLGRDVQFAIGDLPPCCADPSLLQQVWLNLLSNAVKYTSKRSAARIEVGCRAEVDRMTYFVKDNGVGFDMRYAHKLFGVFQRLHRIEDYEGTGVGLAIVQRIVHRHGGRVWVDAEPNRGAIFFFTLSSGS